ncbi:helix-turn-helix domain-containing protein [Arcobacter sp.]|uniref:helix-turn-helix domain-containing protein n=1 Tax=Arcobacter sp. TaxID=1872629 RepID=UPI003D0C7CD9
MLNEHVNIYITNIDKEYMDVIQNEYNEKFHIKDNSIHLEIPKSLYGNSLLIELHDFLEKFKNKKKYQLTSNCSFDVNNLLLIKPNKIEYLTFKEGEFLKHLLKTNEIITYEYMSELLWNDNINISQNALRLFVKNLKKKLPTKILKNIRGIGYKLNLSY